MKSVLLFSLILGSAWGQSSPGAVLISSDRYFIKILDCTISLQDLRYQLRNLKGMACIYDNSFIVQYFGKDFLGSLDKFLKDFPKSDEEVRRYLHQSESLLKKIRLFLKSLRYAEDQKGRITPELTKLIHESVASNKCDKEILHGSRLKTNFVNLLQLEIYLRSRYGGQILNTNRSFDTIRPSIDLFVESLDKQFNHEYYW